MKIDFEELNNEITHEMTVTLGYTPEHAMHLCRIYQVKMMEKYGAQNVYVPKNRDFKDEIVSLWQRGSTIRQLAIWFRKNERTIRRYVNGR